MAELTSGDVPPPEDIAGREIYRRNLNKLVKGMGGEICPPGSKTAGSTITDCIDGEYSTYTKSRMLKVDLDKMLNQLYQYQNGMKNGLYIMKIKGLII